MGFWKDIRQFRAKRLVRQADSYLWDFHKRFAYTREDAIAKCRKAIRLSPDYAEAYLVLANALNKEGTRDDAIVQYRRAIEIAPDLYYGYINLAKALEVNADLDTTADKVEESQQFLEEAVSLYKRAFAIQKGDWQERSYFGRVLEALGRQDEAIAEYKNALKDDPDNSWLLGCLGSSLCKKGLYDEALAIYKQMVEKDPEDQDNHYYVGEVLAAMGRTEDALSEYRKAEAHIKAGELLLESGRHDEALKEFKTSIQKDPTYGDIAYYHIGLLLSEKKQGQEALEHLRTFLKLVDQKDPLFFTCVQGRQEAYDQFTSEAKRIIEELEK